jgi:hypothetical protein
MQMASRREIVIASPFHYMARPPLRTPRRVGDPHPAGYVPPLNFSQVPLSFCCSTPGFDQSHTPVEKIFRARVISSDVKATR